MDNVSVINDGRSYSFKDKIANSKIVKISKFYQLKKKSKKLMKKEKQLDLDTEYYKASINENNNLKKQIENDLSKLNSEIEILKGDISKKPIKRVKFKPIRIASNLLTFAKNNVANRLANSLISKGYGDISQEVEPMVARMEDTVIPTDRNNTDAEKNKYDAMDEAVKLAFSESQSAKAKSGGEVELSFSKTPSNQTKSSDEGKLSFGQSQNNQGEEKKNTNDMSLDSSRTKPLPKKDPIKDDMTNKKENDNTSDTKSLSSGITLQQQLDMIKATKDAIGQQNVQMENTRKKYAEEIAEQEAELEARKIAAAKQILEQLTAQQTANNEKMTAMASDHEKAMEAREKEAKAEIAKMFAEAGVKATDDFKPKGYSF